MTAITPHLLRILLNGSTASYTQWPWSPARAMVLKKLRKDNLMRKRKIGAQPINLSSITQALFAAQTQSFRRAARVLGIPQSVISRRVRRLEQLLGVKLFDRQHDGVRVTAAGSRFLQQAGQILVNFDRALKGAIAAGRGPAGQLKIGILSSMADGFLRDLIQLYLTNHPDIAVSIVEGTAAEHVNLVRKCALDVAFILEPVKIEGCEMAPLWSERLFAVLPVRHTLTKMREIDWQALQQENLIVRKAERGPVICGKLKKLLSCPGRQPRLQKLDVGRETMMHLVAMGLGVGLTSEASVAVPFPQVTFRPMTGGDEMLKFCAVWSRRNKNPAVRGFLKLAQVMASKRKRSAGTRRPRPRLHHSGFASSLILAGRALATSIWPGSPASRLQLASQ